MKKLLKRILLLTMAIMMAFGFSACSPDNPDNPDNPDKPTDSEVTTDAPVNTVTESEEHLVTNGLHDVKVTESTRLFRENGSTSYKIVFGEDTDSMKAASFMQQHITPLCVTQAIRQINPWTHYAKHKGRRDGITEINPLIIGRSFLQLSPQAKPTEQRVTAQSCNAQHPQPTCCK